MFKKYKAFMKNEGAFEQPGARALQDFISTRNEHVQLERAANAVKVAQQRVVEAEEAAREAEARAVVAHAELDSVVDRSASVTGRSSGSETQSLISRMSNETIMRELSQKHPPPTKRVTSRESGSETQSLVSRISKGQQLPPPTTWATSRKAGSETSLVSRASDERLYTQKLPPPTARGSSGSGSTTHSPVSRVSDDESLMRERSFTRKLPPLTTRATSRGSGSETQSVVSGASDERLYTQKPPPPTTRGLSGGSGSTTHGLVSRVSDESLMRERSFTRKLSSPITRATSRGWGSETESEISRVSNEQLFTKKLPPPTTRARSGSDQSQVSRVSNETVLRERLFPQRLPPPTKPVPPVRKSESSTCSVCSARCLACPNPWQRTRSDLMVAEINRPKPVPYGITLKPCDHVFCGACLAQTIYHCLDMAFDSATYGTKLPSYAHDGLDPGRPDFPVLCPTCQAKKGGKVTEINDATARLVLGESNMEEWNHARFWSTLRLLQCPYQGCDHTFDIDDAIPLGSFPHRESCVECPHCEGLLCKTCRSVWHENMTCFMYQTLPRNEEPVRKRHGWAPTLHTSPSQNGGKRSARADSPGGMYNPGSMYSTPSTGSADSLNYGAESSYSPESPPYSTGAPYTPRESPRNQRRPPPWAHGHDKQSYF